GAPPNLKQPITGCRFAERCEYAREACREAPIASRLDEGRRYRCLFDAGTLREWYASDKD
ncbi:ABC transporter ATP-binding protein, partial [Paenibacillus dendritiformis]|nr:ABC transporter ATP-binding protein [Paenibacillus dendritiformis]